ncbi:hypothetical protein DL768_009388 [Monosporascus sp. mg162]|nr:hypothetical protein DL768_009388 [Monosporascus sp. mg162]
MNPSNDASEARQRKRLQNRAAQRTYREKLKRRIEDLERWRDVALTFTGLNGNARPETVQDDAIDAGITPLASRTISATTPEQTQPLMDIGNLSSLEWPEDTAPFSASTPQPLVSADWQTAQLNNSPHICEELESQSSRSLQDTGGQEANIVRLLLQWVPDPNVKDAQGKAALHLAVEHNCLESVKVTSWGSLRFT